MKDIADLLLSLSQQGTEVFHSYYGHYDGTIVSNNGDGTINLQCPALYGLETVENIKPISFGGNVFDFHVADKDDSIYVVTVNGDVNAIRWMPKFKPNNDKLNNLDTLSKKYRDEIGYELGNNLFKIVNKDLNIQLSEETLQLLSSDYSVARGEKVVSSINSLISNLKDFYVAQLNKVAGEIVFVGAIGSSLSAAFPLLSAPITTYTSILQNNQTTITNKLSDLTNVQNALSEINSEKVKTN